MPLALLTFITGLAISAVAIYYSVLGLASIFSAAVIPIVVMGTILELSKLVTAWWLKSNWHRAPMLLKSYMLAAVVVLMVITSMGIFGFLSKAHSDQSLVSGDVQSKIAVYDEKIKIAKENIDANRKALRQMDEAVDQVMGRSQDEKGADKAVALRRGQAKERTRLLSEIAAEQKAIAKLSEERAPIAAEVRKVEAEVGPIKYIAAFIYGDNPDANILEKAVTWVIIVIVFVFDPLAVLLLLASQMSFQWVREEQEKDWGEDYFQGIADDLNDVFGQETTATSTSTGFVAQELKDVIPEAVSEDDLFPTYEEITPKDEEIKPHHPDTHPYLRQGFKYPDGWMFGAPLVAKVETKETVVEEPTEVDPAVSEALKWAEEQRANQLKEEVEKHGYSAELGIVKVNNKEYTQSDFERLMRLTGSYIQNEEQEESGLWKQLNSKITEQEYLEASAKRKNDNSNNAS